MGYLVHLISLRLAREIELEPSRSWPYRFGPAAALALLFALAAWRIGLRLDLPVLWIYATVFVQIAFFDWEHRLILFKIALPAMAVAAVLSLRPGFAPGLVGALVGGVAAGLAFLIIFGVGLAVKKEEVLGFGDVVLATLIGLSLGLTTELVRALLAGVFLAGLCGFLMLVLRMKGMRDFFAYGPYLCVGALLVLYGWGAQ